MDLRDFSEIGQQIERTVKNAVDSMNFNELNQNINDTFNRAFKTKQNTGFHYKPKNPYDAAGENYQTDEPHRTNTCDSASGHQKTQWHYERSSQRSQRSHQTNASAHDFQASPSSARNAVGFPTIVNPPGRISSILMMIAGYSGLAITGAALIISLAFSAFIGRFFTVGAAFSIISLPILIVSAILAINGTKTRGRLSRFKQYVEVLKGRTFCSLKELTQKVGKSKNYVLKDIHRLIEAGFFPEGHIDEQKTCLMVTDKIYEQYLIAQQSMKERCAQQPKDYEHSSKAQTMTTEETAAFDKIIASGEMYMQHIREANDAIPDTEISNKLYRMELIIQKIFDYVRSHPDQLSQLRRFIDYYMPTTDKLVTAYKEFDTQPIQGDNIKTAKQEIAKALDTINDAYEKLYDSMYAEAAMDVASDISVLQTLLAQEGLTKDDFNHGRKK